MTLREIAQKYGQHLDQTSRHAKGHRRALERFLAKLGWLRFEEVRARHGNTYAELRAQDGVQAGTVAQEITMATAMLRWWAKRHELAKPALERPRRPAPRRRWLREEEAERLLAACLSPHVRLFVTLALNTGARSGAILGLTWRQVDLEHRSVDFGVGGPGKERAAVPINDDLLAALEEAQALATTPYVVEYAGGRIGSVKRAFAEACTRAGLKDVRPHDLRRTAGSWLLQRGVPIGLVAAMLGHKDVRVTAYVYAHLDVEHLRGAAEALGRGWRKR